MKGEKVSLKIVKLENRFAAVLRNVDNANAQKNNTTNDGDVQYSIEYKKAKVNTELLQLIKKVQNNDYKSNEKVYLGEVSQENAQRIFNLTGVNVNGYKIAIEARQIDHILTDHGKNGKTDHSMADPKNIAKIEYALNHADDIRNKSKTQAYSYMKNGRNRTADTVLYECEKVIGDKSYYVVQTAVDTKSQTLFIVSAFIGEKGYKKETSQLINANSPDATSKDGSVVVSNPNVSQDTPEVNTHYTQESENYSSQEQNDGGILYSFGDIDKGNKKRDNISRANKTGELINEFYYALDKSEWNLFYRKIAESGFLEKTDVGDRVAIAIGGKLLIADRQLRGTDAHDFQIVAAYQEENGDWYVTNEIADIINESEGIYDQRTVEKTILRVSKIYDETPIFSVYDREHMQFISSSSFGKTNGRSTTTDGGHRTRTYGEGISSPVKQNTQRINAGLDDSAFSMPENDDVKYSFEDDVVDKTSSLAERVRLGEISQTEYLNELQRLMNEATEKYGAIPKGENPVVSNLS